MGHNCLHVRFFLLDLDSDLDLRSVDLDLPSLKRTWTCSLKVDLDLTHLRIVDLDFTVAGLVTSLVHSQVKQVVAEFWFIKCLVIASSLALAM